MDSSNHKIIHTYTRKQAFKDGVLVDVTEQAKENGFKLPVAVSCNLYHGYVVPNDSVDGEGQSVEDRLHDLFMITKAAAASRWKDNRVSYDVLFKTGPKTLEMVRCLAIVGPGDDGEPVMTLMLPGDE